MADVIVALRHATTDDDAFLEHLLRSTRGSEFTALDASAADQLLRMQFRAQQQDYSERFDPSGHLIITCSDEPIGRLWVHCDGLDWVLVDIAVLPEHQGNGIASVLLADVAQQADATGATVSLQVRADNRSALRLYLHHGFTIDESSELDLRMSRRSTTRHMARFDVVRRAVLADPALQARLRSCGRDAVAEEILVVASDLGIALDRGDVDVALREAKAQWFGSWV